MTIRNTHTPATDPNLLRIAIILVIGILPPLMDSTMVNVGIETIAKSLMTDVSMIQWVTTGYILTMAVAVPISGWAIERFGGKRLYMASQCIFLAGSILCAISPNIDLLIASRILQGLGAGLLMPTLQTMIVQASGGKGLGNLMSLVGIPAVLGPVIGPMVGGIIVDTLGWRWIFYVNIPIGIIALILAVWGLPRNIPDYPDKPLDILGVGLLSSVFAFIVYGITQATKNSGFINSHVLLPAGIGLVLAILFILYTLHNTKDPVLDIHLFTKKNFNASVSLLFLSGMINNGPMFLLPLLLQQVYGYSALHTGLLMLPQGVGMLLVRSQIGRFTDKNGAKNIVIISLIVTVIGTLPLALVNTSTSMLLVEFVLLIRGAGIGGISIPIMTSIYFGLEHHQYSHASITTRIFQTVGGAFGTAFLVTVLQKGMLSSLLNGFHQGFTWSVIIAVISLIPAFFLLSRQEYLHILNAEEA